MPYYCPFCQKQIPTNPRTYDCPNCHRAILYLCPQKVNRNSCGHKIGRDDFCTSDLHHANPPPTPPPAPIFHCHCVRCGIELPDKSYDCFSCHQQFKYYCPFCGIEVDCLATSCSNGHQFQGVCPSFPRA